MPTIRDTPFSYPKQEKPVSDPQVAREDLIGLSKRFSNIDLVMYVRAYIQERSPAAFSEYPLLWEAIREWLGKRLGVNAREIGLSGSAQTGFSLNPKKPETLFNPKNSDLDFFVVSSVLFEKFSSELTAFIAKQNPETKFFNQAETVSRSLRRNYVDLVQVPADHTSYPKISAAHNDVSIVISRLKHHGFDLKKSHLRIYRNWDALGEWVKLAYGSK